MRKTFNYVLTGLFVSFYCVVAADSAAAQSKYWVFFSDKPLAETPPALSEDALARRAARGIETGWHDRPVFAGYLKQLARTAADAPKSSRWLNAAVVRLDAEGLERVLGLPFVRSARPVRALRVSSAGKTASPGPPPLPYSENWYGPTWRHFQSMRLPALHQAGLNGAGVRIAVFDAGFPAADTLAAFAHLRERGGLVAAYDFVDNKSLTYDGADHGLEVLSSLAAYQPETYVGAAWGADYLLARTERAEDESKMEEDAWVRAMEWADSIGVDIINTSLNYNIFDDELDNYKYADLDGDTPLITRAADIAASRGILVVNSAGNDGAARWRHIIPPCDGDSVLCVGALNLQGRAAAFSSRGPAADGRIKPDVAAPGVMCPVLDENGSVAFSQGTSFAAPLVAGLAACLWQSQPGAGNMDIYSAIVQTASRSDRPGNEIGAGLPDAPRADSLLRRMCGTGSLKVYPNPVTSGEVFRFEVAGEGNYLYALYVYDAYGRPVYKLKDLSPRRTYEIDIQAWDGGKYRLRAVWRNGSAERHILYFK